MTTYTPLLLKVQVQSEDFNLGDEVNTLRAGRHDIGAVVSFVGAVRQWLPDGSAACALELEHYPGMTERLLREAAEQAAQRFDLQAVSIIHRVGSLSLGDQIVLVAAASAHRQAAFEGCHYLMDWLKTGAPFWKREVHRGQGRWVEARTQDHDALARWSVSSKEKHT